MAKVSAMYAGTGTPPSSRAERRTRSAAPEAWRLSGTNDQGPSLRNGMTGSGPSFTNVRTAPRGDNCCAGDGFAPHLPFGTCALTPRALWRVAIMIGAHTRSRRR